MVSVQPVLLSYEYGRVLHAFSRVTPSTIGYNRKSTFSKVGLHVHVFDSLSKGQQGFYHRH